MHEIKYRINFRKVQSYKGEKMKSSLLSIVLLALTFTFISCSSGNFVDLNELRSELKVKDFPTQKDYPEADALVLSEAHYVKVSINELYKLETVEEVKKVTKLFKNIDDYASVGIPVLSGNKITDIFARTIKPNGDIIELKRDDFHTITGG